MGLTEFNMALFIIAITAITIGALLKGMTGVGLPLIAVPAIATFTSVEEAVAEWPLDVVYISNRYRNGGLKVADL